MANIKLDKIPILKEIIRFTQGIKLSSYNGFSLYDFFVLYLTGISKGAFSNRASSIAFSFFMAMFPFALFILNLIPYIPIEGFQEDFLVFVSENVPPKTYDAIAVTINDILNNSYDSLLSSGFLLSIFLMSNGLNAIFSGFQSSYHITERRGFFKDYLIAIGMSLLLVCMLLLTVAFLVLFEVVVYFLEHHWHLIEHIPLLHMLKIVLGFALILLSTSFLYKFGTKDTRGISFFNWGSFLTSILIIVSSFVFGIYVEKFSNYNELYGSIGTLLVLMFYIWINCTILLLGFELNVSLLQLKNTDTLEELHEYNL